MLKGGQGYDQAARDQPSGSRLVMRAKPLPSHSMGSKNKELEAPVRQESYIFAIMETWWDDSHDWSAAMDTSKPFRRHRQSRRGGGVELHGPVSKIRGKVSRVDLMVVGVCFIPPNQDEQRHSTSIWLKSHGC